jgi:hypothetical protein
VLGDLPAFIAFALLALLGPGLGLQRWLRLPVDPALALPLGTALAAASYWVSLATGWPWLFPVALGLGLLGLLRRGSRLRASGPSLRGAIPSFLAVVVLLAVTQYRWNRLALGGEFLLDPFVASDTAFHVGLTRELTLQYPPQLPGVSGFPLGYHLGTDLVRAAALRWGGIDPYDSIARFDVTLWALGLILALRGLVRALGGSPLAVALVPWTLLATDFSFLFAGNPQAHWWSDLLRGNLLISLALANPIVPALTLALGCLIALSRHQAGEGRGWLLLAAGLGAAVPWFKVFLGAHLLLGLGAAALLAQRQRRALAALVIPCLLGTAVLALGQGGRTVTVSLAPLDLLLVTRETLALPPLTGAPLLLWASLWLLASLGLRVVALPATWRALTDGPTIGRVLAAMALAAWPLGLLFRVSAPEVLAGQKIVNDSAYLVEQGGPLLWVFTAIVLASWATTRARTAGLLALAAALALPSTFQFAAQKARLDPDPIPAPMVRAMHALAAVSQPGDVAMQRPGGRYPPVPVILIGRRVPYERFTPYLTQFAKREDLERRHEIVYRFFRTGDREQALAIASELGASFLCLYGADRVRFDTTGILEPIHQEAGARVYRIKP